MWESVLLPLIVAVLAGGSAAAVIQVALARRRLRVEELFERRARSEQAHREAANKHADKVSQIHRILDDIAWHVLGDDAGVWNFHRSTSIDPPTSAARAIELLQAVRSGHPTKQVRDTARQLQEDLVGFYANPPHEGMEHWPSYKDKDRLTGDLLLAEELIEQLHTLPVMESSPSNG